MAFLVTILVLAGLIYLTRAMKRRYLRGGLIVALWLVIVVNLDEVSDTLTALFVLGSMIWWLGGVSRRRKKKRQLAEADTAFFETQSTSSPVDNPIRHYATTPKRRAALAELESSPQALESYIHQEIDTFFMNEWTKMAAIYSDQTHQFDEDVRENAGQQMREILDAIFVKFARQERARLAEKLAINEELKSKHKQEIDIAMQVYDKWQDKV
jgi:hypothetical protein